jgi:L-alanine-DL-glutamate epimerase-like enolase superfamily enzyme
MAIATVFERTTIVVRVRTDDGLTGLGEAVVASYFTGETLASAHHLITDVIGPELIGKDPRELVAIRTAMSRMTFGNQAARAAVEMALHDLVARSAGVPLFDWYGGRTRVDVPTIWHVSGTEPTELAESAAAAVDDGYSIVKVKVGGDVENDVAKVDAVREAVGADVMILADANQGWDVPSAVRFSRAIADLGVAFIEQPVHYSDVIGMAAANRAPVPIAADEGVFDAAALTLHTRLDAVSAVVVKLMKSAGPIGARELIAVADASGIGIHFAGMPGQSSIGAAHAVHLASAIPTLVYGAGICPYYLEADIVDEPLVATNGALRAPESDGIGLDLDEAMLARFVVDL